MSWSAICDPNDESCTYDAQDIVQCKPPGNGWEQSEELPPECLPITA